MTPSPQSKGLKDLPPKFWLYILGGIFVLYIAYSIAASFSRSIVASSPSDYNPNRTCDETKDINRQYDLDVYQFDVDMTSGCFSGWISLPQWWPDWHYQPKGDQTRWWIAFWFPAPAKPTAALYPNSIYEAGSLPRVFRIQGHEHGIVHFYTNKPEERTQILLPKPGQTAGTNVVEANVPIEAKREPPNYQLDKFCNDPPQHEMHYEHVDTPTFHVTLQEGCWSDIIFTPNYWQSFYFAESEGTDPNWWVAIWRTGHAIAGPFTRDDSRKSPYWRGWTSPSFRLQGRGEIVFSHAEKPR